MMDNEKNIEKLRSAWRDIKIETPCDVTASLGVRKAVAGSRRALMERFSRLEIACLAMAFAVPWLLWHRLEMSAGLALTALAFFILAAVSIESIRRSLRRIDPGRMTVVEALEAVYESERRILRHRIVGWIVAIPLLGWMLMSFYRENSAAFAGGCAGLVVGLIIGYLCWRKVRAILLEMKAELEEETGGE